MKKFIKIALIVVGVIIVLITAAALLIPRLVDPNQYKDKISALVKEKTGRELTITGDISLSVFPWLGVKIGAVEIGNAPGFDAGAFAALQQVQVKVKLIPLLSKQVEADVVSVRGLVLNLTRGADGRTNWEDLTGSSTPPVEDQPTQAPALAALAVGGVDLQDARITWTDHFSGQNITLNNLSVKTSEVNLVDPVTVAIGFDLDTGEIGVVATVTTAAQLQMDLDSGRYTVKDLSLQADLKGDTIPGGNVTVTVGGQIAFDAGTRGIDFSTIRLEAEGLNLAPYTVGAVIETDGAGDMVAGSFDLNGLKVTATLTDGQDRLTAELAANAKADLTTQQIVVSDLALTVPEVVMQGFQGKIDAPRTGSARVNLASGTFALEGLALSGTLAGDALPGGSLPVSLGLTVQGDLAGKALTVSPLQFAVAGVTTTTTLTLGRNHAGPEVRGTLTVAAFNPRELLHSLGLAPPETADAGALSTAEFSTEFMAGTDAVSISKLSVRLDDSTLTGALGVNSFTAPEVQVDLALDRIRPQRYLPPRAAGKPRKLLSEITLKGALAMDAGFKTLRVTRFAAAGKLDKKIPFGLSATDTLLNLNDQTLSTGKLVLTVDQMTLQAKIDVTGLSTKPTFRAAVQTETFNLRQILSDLDLLPETADPKAMSAVAISAALSGSSDGVSVSSLKLRLDDTRIEGTADVTLAPAPAYAFDIAMDSIDADRYLPPPAPETTGKKTTPQTATPGAAATAIPVELLRGLDLDGKIALGKLKITNLRLTDIQVQALAKDGLLTLHPLRAGLYGGVYSGNIRLDARGKVPSLALDETLAGVQSGNLLKDLQGKAMVTGLANADMKLTAAGADTDALISSLNGTVSFNFIDGTVKGMDIAGKLCNTLSAVSAGSLKAQDLVGSVLQKLVQKAAGTETTTEADATAFSEMGGSMTFAKGVGTSKDLVLKSPLLRVEGAGTLDLTRQYLDYQATAALVKSCQGQGGESFGDLENIPIPVTISGPLEKLEVKPNLTSSILQILTRNQSKQAEKTSTAATQTSTTEKTGADQQPAAAKPQEEPATVEDAVKGILQDLLKKK